MKSRDLDAKQAKPIYGRITYAGKRKDWSTNIKINPKNWNKGNTCVSNKEKNYFQINQQLQKIKEELEKVYRDQQSLDIDITPSTLFNQYQGKEDYSNKKSILEVFEYHNLRMVEKSKIGKYSPNTIKRYEITLEKVKRFISSTYKKEDFYLEHLKVRFLVDFEHFLLTTDKISMNTAHKYIKNVKKVVNFAIAMNWLEIDPFKQFKCTYSNPDREILTQAEINTLANTQLPNEKLESVRDVFLFSCYTGFAYSDLANLTVDDISKGFDGDLWISTNRTKTGTKENLPLLPPAMALIEKYNDHACRIEKGKLLNVFSNQKYNIYLKTVAELCNINKKLTTHTARHTFATTITLTNGVPIETVSKMLGHKSIKTTQIYAKVIETKVSADMKALKAKLYPGQQNEENFKIG
ncbi:Site-specific recombinase XerD [Lishizhenia tianjinensis]|uniref:Site-specific recombinase XerD n=1 Tax=Lishizhenia tianjinensis TaxID=477690 RepID=A0A1I6YAM8_9FLAO|nr:site-specific integrase [Lishizhenia tianjinensis]SFT47589.1 Site-specific recombinase XerD [Lishizhenia tianjinensis]